jgi:hypothetical protein
MAADFGRLRAHITRSAHVQLKKKKPARSKELTPLHILTCGARSRSRVCCCVFGRPSSMRMQQRKRYTNLQGVVCVCFVCECVYLFVCLLSAPLYVPGICPSAYLVLPPQLQTAVEHLNLFERTPEQWAADIRVKQALIEKHKSDVALLDDIVRFLLLLLCRFHFLCYFSELLFLALCLLSFLCTMCMRLLGEEEEYIVSAPSARPHALP